MEKEDKQTLKEVFQDEITFLQKKDEVLSELEEKHGWLAMILTGTDESPDLNYRHAANNASPEAKAEVQAHNEDVKLKAGQWLNRAKLFRALENSCTKYIWDKIKSHQNFQAISTEKNPIKLWRLMVSTLTPTEEMRNRKYRTEKDKLKAIEQGKDSYKEFISKFDKQLEIYVGVGGDRYASDVFEYFIAGLDKMKHHKSLIEIDKLNIRKYPEAKVKLEQFELTFESTLKDEELYPDPKILDHGGPKVLLFFMIGPRWSNDTFRSLPSQIPCFLLATSLITVRSNLLSKKNVKYFVLDLVLVAQSLKNFESFGKRCLLSRYLAVLDFSYTYS